MRLISRVEHAPRGSACSFLLLCLSLPAQAAQTAPTEAAGRETGPREAQPAASAKAELTCRPEAAPGRVLCELRVSPLGPNRLVWADALVRQAPEFARPLRSRVSVARFGEGGGTAERRMTLAFMATTEGTGQVLLAARAVVCEGTAPAERCHAETLELSAELRVGM